MSMMARIFSLMLLVGVLAALTPLAYGSAPDPSWIRGVYDDDDFDNVVVLITSGAGMAEPVPLDGFRPLPVVVGPVHQVEKETIPVLAFSSNPPRGPPSP